ncbi:MAG: FAD-binding oxidoreductase [Rhodospirillaceae bacterium]|nr:MAG: FAD-binding oxidoreductase [Rhodospirillaceae bacterium]
MATQSLQKAHDALAAPQASARTLADGLEQPNLKRRPRLSSAAMREFAEILGPRNITDDPAVRAGYSWSLAGGGLPTSQQFMEHWSVAIALPGSTEEVQAVVKACLRHGLKFRAQSTGMAAFSCAMQESVVAIDLRRMDKLVEIDAKNQMAVIEPYVTGAQLQAEAMKVGLTTHIIGAGWTHSPLASATSYGGVGIGGNYTGNNQRNLMAWEWVTPEGELIRAGSAGAGSGWFAGEGPGPGFRGMLRGNCGAGGGLGVFTRIGYKLHPWTGPAQFEHRGVHPQWGIPLSDTMRFYQVVWDDWEGPRDAAYGFMISNAPTYILRMPADHIGWTLHPTNREFYDSLVNGTLPDIARTENRISWTLLVLSETHAEAEWRERTIRAIVEKTRGRFLDVAPEHAEVLARNAVTSCYVPRVFRAGSRQVMTSVGVFDSFKLLPEVVKTGERLMRPYREQRKTINQGVPEGFWMWPSEGRHYWAENIISCDNDSVESGGDGTALVLQITEDHAKHPRGVNAFALGGDLAEMYGKALGLNTWMAKVKNAFDPEDAADGLYPTGKKNIMTRLWPIARPFLFGIPFLLRLAMRLQVKYGK